MAIIENRILEKNLAAKKKAEKRAKNIAVSDIDHVDANDDVDDVDDVDDDDSDDDGEIYKTTG